MTERMDKLVQERQRAGCLQRPSTGTKGTFWEQDVGGAVGWARQIMRRQAGQPNPGLPRTPVVSAFYL